MVATIDRGVLSVLVEYIKRDLHVSDTQFSVLTGFAFVFFTRSSDCRSPAWPTATAAGSSSASALRSGAS
jgi:hypothetical protein